MKTVALFTFLLAFTFTAHAASNTCQIAIHLSCERECGPGYKRVTCFLPKSGHTFDLEACVTQGVLQKTCAPGGVPTRTSFNGEVGQLPEAQDAVSAAGDGADPADAAESL